MDRIAPSRRPDDVQAAGLPALSGPPHALASPGVDVDVFPLQKVN